MLSYPSGLKNFKGEKMNKFMETGKQCFASREYEQARIHFNKVLEFEPDNLEALKFIGDSYIIQKNKLGSDKILNNIITLCKNKLANNPHDAITFILMGDSYSKLFVRDEALKCFEKAIQLDPDLSEGYYKLANLLYAEGDNEKAEEYYKITLEKNPQHATALFNLGNICQRENKPLEAIDYFKKALEINPYDYLSILKIGVICFEKNNYQDAISNFKKVTTIAPSIDAYNYLCKAYNAINDQDNALNCVVQIARLGDPKAQQFLMNNGISW